MKTRKKRNMKEAKTEAAPKAASAKGESAPVRPSKIKVLKKDASYRGARGAWYTRLKEYDGKTEGEFLANTKEKPPAVPKNGTAENPAGWVRFFVRQGVMSLQA